MTGRRGVSPTVRRRRLGAELRRYREAAGFTIDQVAERMDCSASKISRLETGQTGSSPRDVRDILALYQVGEAEIEDLLEVARETRQRGWWQQHGAVLTSAFIGFEAAAHVTSARTRRSACRACCRPRSTPASSSRAAATTPRSRSRIGSGSGWRGNPADPGRAARLLVCARRGGPAAPRRRTGGDAAPTRSTWPRCPHWTTSRSRCCRWRSALTRVWTDRSYCSAFPTRGTRTPCTSPWPPVAFFKRSPMNCSRYHGIFDRLTDAALTPEDSMALVLKMAKEPT